MRSILKSKMFYILISVFTIFVVDNVGADVSNSHNFKNIYEQFLRENNIPIYFVYDRFVVDESISEDDLVRFLKLLRLSADIISNNIANINTTRTSEGGAFRRNRIIIVDGRIDMITIDNYPPKLVYDPTHPDSILFGSKIGYVEFPNINIVSEMVDLILVSRIFENIVEECILRNITIPAKFQRLQK